MEYDCVIDCKNKTQVKIDAIKHLLNEQIAPYSFDGRSLRCYASDLAGIDVDDLNQG